MKPPAFFTLFGCSVLLLAWHSRGWVATFHSLPEELPRQECKEAQATGIDYSLSIPMPQEAPSPLPMPNIPEVERPTSLPNILNPAGERIVPHHYMPEDLGFQPLEGTKNDIAKIGHVLRQADKGERVRITFFGASHTGGDYWTGHIRRVLQARYGDIGHGFTMPIALYSGARGADINLCHSGEWIKDYVGKRDGHDDQYFGLGMSVSSSDPQAFGWLETTHSNPIGRQVDTFEIVTLGQPGGGSLLAQIDRNPPILIPTHTESADIIHTRLDFPLGSHRLTLRPAGDGDARIFGVSVERSGPGILIDSIGIRGREARTWLKWNEDLFQKSLHILDPDIIVLAYGTNEANSLDYDMEQYGNDLRSVLRKMRRASPEVGCILVGPSDRGKEIRKKTYQVWERTKYVAEVQRTVAPEFGCVSWDWQQATGGEGSMIAWRHTDPPLAGQDLIHFTPAGYIHSAELFLSALDDAALNYKWSRRFR